MKNPSLNILLSCILVLSLTASATSKEFFETSSIQEWNQGSFSETSATRNANSGNLGLGYRNGTTSDSLVGYWRLDRSISSSGGTVKDYSGNKNDGTAKNGVTTGAEGIFSTGSFGFDGSNDYVKIPYNSDFAMDGGFTLSAWVNFHENAGSTDDFIAGTGGGWDDRGFMIFRCDGCSNPGIVRWEVQDSSNKVNIDTDEAFTKIPAGL
jgi:hypothetical protein